MPRLASPAIDALVARVAGDAGRFAPADRRDLRGLLPQLARHQRHARAGRDDLRGDRRHSRHVASRLGGPGPAVRSPGGRGRGDPRHGEGPDPAHRAVREPRPVRERLQCGAQRERAPVRPDGDDAVDVGAEVGARLALLPGAPARATGGSATRDASVFDEEVHRMLRAIVDTMRTEQRHDERSTYRFWRTEHVYPNDNLADGGRGAPVGDTGHGVGRIPAERRRVHLPLPRAVEHVRRRDPARPCGSSPAISSMTASWRGTRNRAGRGDQGRESRRTPSWSIPGFGRDLRIRDRWARQSSPHGRRQRPEPALDPLPRLPARPMTRHTSRRAPSC